MESSEFAKLKADRDRLAGELAAAQQDLAAARAEVERVRRDIIEAAYEAVNDDLRICATCGMEDSQPHASDCWVGRILAGIKQAAPAAPEASEPTVLPFRVRWSDSTGEHTSCELFKSTTDALAWAKKALHSNVKHEIVSSGASVKIQNVYATPELIRAGEPLMAEKAAEAGRRFVCPKCGGLTPNAVGVDEDSGEIVVLCQCSHQSTWSEVAAAKVERKRANEPMRRETTMEPETWHVITMLNVHACRLPHSIFRDKAEADKGVADYFSPGTQAMVEPVVRKSAYAAERSARESAEQRAERAEAGAAAMREVFGEVIDWQGIDHEDEGCPEDDTCSCHLVARVNAVFAHDAGRNLLNEVRTLRAFISKVRNAMQWANFSPLSSLDCIWMELA